MGRAAQGVRLINLKGTAEIAAVARVPRADEEEEGEEGEIIDDATIDSTEIENSEESTETSED